MNSWTWANTSPGWSVSGITLAAVEFDLSRVERGDSVGVTLSWRRVGPAPRFPTVTQLSIETDAPHGPLWSRATSRLDRIWMQRFTGEGTAPDRLDAILFEAFGELRAAREAEDRRIVAFVDGLDDGRIAGMIRYRRVSSPELIEQPLAAALAHWFNHQTHHRGQVHALLTGLVGKAPELDLLYFQRLSAKPAA